jgi:hypothetical protein
VPRADVCLLALCNGRMDSVVPNRDLYLEIWPPAFRTYNVMVPNLLNLPFMVWGLGAPRSMLGLAMHVSSRAAGCMYCSAHTTKHERTYRRTRYARLVVRCGKKNAASAVGHLFQRGLVEGLWQHPYLAAFIQGASLIATLVSHFAWSGSSFGLVRYAS